MNQPTRAETHYANAIRHFGGLPDREQIFIRASAKRARNDFGGAAQILGDYLASHPDDVGVLRALAYNQMRLEKSDDAVAAFTKVLAVDSLDQVAWINLANAENNLGHTTEAIRAYHRAFALAPMRLTANDNVNLEFALTFVTADLLDSARAVINLLVNHSEVSRRARGLRSMSYLAAYSGQYAEAARALSQANVLIRSRAPTGSAPVSEVRNFVLLATVLTELGRTSEAARALDSAYAIVMRIDAEGTLLYWVGKALARAGDARRSAALVAALERKARPNSPSDRAALSALRGEALVARGRAAEAVAHLEAAWLADSIHPAMIESRAFVAEAAGNLDLATALYQRLAGKRHFGNEGQYPAQMASYRLGRVYERANKPGDARAAYERFITNLPKPDAALGAVVDARARLRLLVER